VCAANSIARIDTDSIQATAQLLAEAAERISNCETALARLATSPPFSFGVNLPFDLPTADPAATWNSVENAIDYARFASGGTTSVLAASEDLIESLHAAAEMYIEHERAITQQFERGQRFGQSLAHNLIKFLNELGQSRLEHASVIQRMAFGMVSARAVLNATMLTGDQRGTFLGLIQAGMPLTHFLMTEAGGIKDHDGAALADVIAIIRGEAKLGDNYQAEEFVALLLGMIEGSKENFIGYPYLTLPHISRLGGRASMGGLPLRMVEDILRASHIDDLQETIIRPIEHISNARSTENMADIANRLADQYGPNKNASKVSVEVITHSDGTQAARVFLPGMSHVGLHATHPNDAAGNLRAIQGMETEQTRAVKEILAGLDLPPGTDIAFAGHSKGGMDAMTLAADPEIQELFNVVSTETFGTPPDLLEISDLTVHGSKERDLPPGIEAIHFSHSEDVVPALDMAVPTSSKNRTHIHTEAAHVLHDSETHPIVSAHRITTYEKTAVRLQGTDDVARWEEAAAPTFAKAGSVSDVYVYEVQKIPGTVDEK